MEKYWNKIESFFGNMKTAMVVLLCFAIFMIFGTFVESYSGAEMAKRLIYQSWPFIFIQSIMFLSIIMAVFQRLPPKKRLSGFYTVHFGLILLFVGPFITYTSGIDGSVFLRPGEPTRKLRLNQDILKIRIDNKKEVTSFLPANAFTQDLDLQYEGIRFARYFPFADEKLTWQEEDNPLLGRGDFHGSEYFLQNKFTGEKLVFSLHPNAADFPKQLTLGPLKVSYWPQQLYQCLTKTPSPFGHYLLNQSTGGCVSLNEENTHRGKTQEERSFIIYRSAESASPITFIPELSPFPIDLIKKDYDTDSDFRVFSLDFFQKGPQLLLFGHHAAFQEDEKWQFKTIGDSNSNKKELALPWMDSTITLLKHYARHSPDYIPFYKWPIFKNNEYLSGGSKALEVKVGNKIFWVQDSRPLAFNYKGHRYTITLEKEVLSFPYEILLDQFKMTHNPGTQDPASFQSFVKVYTPTGMEKHHIYMNNPLKKDQFTFYQASYFQESPSSPQGSILSVNYDPGRPIKYFGSFLLVFGAILHYYLNRKRIKLKLQNLAVQS